MDARPFLGRQARKIALNRGSNGSLLYLNSAYLGRGAWGVEMAARSYFGKSAQDLSVAEGAMLAGLLKGPSFFNPDRHPDRAKERLAYVLGRMKEDGVISAEDNDRALAARGRDPKARRRRGGARGALPACQQALQTLRLPLSDVHWEPAVILDKGGGKRGDGNIRVGIRDGRVLPLNAASLNERKPRQAQRPKFPRTFQGRIRWQDQRHAISARVA